MFWEINVNSRKSFYFIALIYLDKPRLNFKRRWLCDVMFELFNFSAVHVQYIHVVPDKQMCIYQERILRCGILSSVVPWYHRMYCRSKKSRESDKLFIFMLLYIWSMNKCLLLDVYWTFQVSVCDKMFSKICYSLNRTFCVYLSRQHWRKDHLRTCTCI